MIDPARPMARARQVAQLWDWLPAFRTVAETEHLPTASQILNVSPSALSRAVRLLETEVGHPLFDREGRSLVLNERGATLLEAIRDAMRGVHAALEVIDEVRFTGRVKTSADDTWFKLLVEPAWAQLLEEHPQLQPELVRADAESLPAMLRRGDLDVSVTDAPLSTEQLACDLLSELSMGIFVRPDHPLTQRSRLRWTDLEPYLYVAAAHYGEAGWPTHRIPPRFVVETAPAAATICHQRDAVTLLPNAIGKSLCLQRLALDVSGKMPLFVVYRPSLAIHGRTEALVEALRRVAEDTAL